MIDDISAALDWITPVSAFLHSARYGFQVRTIYIPDDLRSNTGYIPRGWTMGDMTEMLSQAGVDNWGHRIWRDHGEFTVCKRDYDRALRLIQRTVMNPRAKAPRHGLSRLFRQFFGDKLAWLLWSIAVCIVVVLVLGALVG